MSLPARLSAHTWMLALFGAGGFWLWLTVGRIQRVDFVTNLVATAAVADPASPTGYAGGLRQLIVPEHNNDSYQWIAQTQQMLARHEWRLRHVDYDNAPFGREVLSPSPYRWWLGLVAGCDHLLFGRPLGRSVERAALVADPVLQLLLLIGTAVFAARQFGRLPAALLSIALVTLYPWSGAFLPGQPNDGGLALICVLGSILPLLAGVRAPPGAGAASVERGHARRRRLFATAGCVGGIGLWIHPATEVPILAGVALGGLLAAWLTRRAARDGDTDPGEPLPWRIWALAGAATSLAAYLGEYYPAHLGGLHLAEVHPLYGLAWLGAGEWLARAAARRHDRPPARLRRSLLVLLLAALPVIALAVLALRPGDRELVAAEAIATRLTNLAGSPVAPNLWAWIRQDGGSLKLAATCLPLLLLLAAAVGLLARRATRADRRDAICLGLGPVVIALALGCAYLSWWNALDAGLVALLAAVVPAFGARRWAAAGALLLGFVPGLLVLSGQARADRQRTATAGDVEALIERDLSQWLALVSGGNAVVLAPPNLTTSLYFHGGLAGLGTLDLENRAGLLAAIRISGASSPDEARALARGRHLKYIVVPSWDNSLDEYARLGTNKYGHSLIALLHRWLPPLWLRPVPYHLPTVEGFEGQSVAIFEVVDVQDNATALSHLAEYFVEMGQLDKAVGVAYTLGHSFPADLGAAVARALVAKAAGETADFEAALTDVQTAIARGDDKTLPWDRRVSLAIALAEGKRFTLARAQVQRCLARVDEARLRSLTTVSLYRLQVMSRAFGLGIEDPRLQALARRLLPAEMRDRI
jgi:hypothetical protein